MKYIISFFFIFSFQFVYANDKPTTPPYQTVETQNWADSMLIELSLEQKIGQLFMVHANGKNLDEKYYKTVDSLIINHEIGGVIFFQSGPNELKKLLKRYNHLSHMPLLAGIDAEWGVAMRLDSVQNFPWMLSLGAIKDDDLVYRFGEEVARQLKNLGLHVNFAPVVDINNNPKNPIIDRRSFGSDRELVANKGLAYMKALQDNNILACAKHFPGHGDTETDSHHSLPLLTHSRSRLDSLELFPFNQLINEGLGGIMMAHMNLLKIDTLGIPSSFSKNLILDILKKDMKFRGLVVSDALNMNALSNYNEPGERELNAFLAGNDILLYPDNIPAAINLIKSAIINDPLLEERLNHSCKQILMIKKWVGAFDSFNHSESEYSFMSESSHLLNRNLSKNAITVLKNENNIIPIAQNSPKIACVVMGPNSNIFPKETLLNNSQDLDQENIFYNRLNNYLPIDKYKYHSTSGLIERRQNSYRVKQVSLQTLLDYDIVIVGVHQPDNNFWEKHHFSDSELDFLKALSDQNKVIVNIFGHPRLINEISLDNIEGLVLSYQNSDSFQDLTAQLMFGSIEAKGSLPISLDNFSCGDGLTTPKTRDISFVLPIEVGVDLDSLNQIDSLVSHAINNQVMPGCQIVISRYGKILYNKSFGFHTYSKRRPVRDDHLYDIASITKIASTAPILMDLVDSRSINLNRKLKRYNPKLFNNIEDYKYTNKGNLKLIDVLTHQAQLFPWIPFYKETLDENGFLLDSLYSDTYSLEYKWQVGKKIYLKTDYRNHIFQHILDSELLDKKEYKYSDLGFYLIQPIVEEKIKPFSIDQYVREKFYNKIEALRITYNPINHFSGLTAQFSRNTGQLNSERYFSIIVPTENDDYFRHQTVRGYVHDQGAALFGGVALHAGLFSNAIDLMKLMQLYLNQGMYLDQRILSKKTVSQFTSSPFSEDGNRRGVIFDKPSIDPEENGPTCDSISHTSFGHSGWTGTLAWADPAEGIVYIFLSNGRSYPNGKNTKLLEQNIRTDIQEIIYKSILY